MKYIFIFLILFIVIITLVLCNLYNKFLGYKIDVEDRLNILLKELNLVFKKANKDKISYVFDDTNSDTLFTSYIDLEKHINKNEKIDKLRIDYNNALLRYYNLYNSFPLSLIVRIKKYPKYTYFINK